MQNKFIIDRKATGIRIHDFFRQNKTKLPILLNYLGVDSANTVYKWFRGESMPSIDHLYQLSKLWGIPMDDILVPIKDNFEGR